MGKARNPQLYNKFIRFKRRFNPKVDTKMRHYELVRDLVPIPLISAHDTVDDIDWDALPEEFVIKADIGTFTSRVKCLRRTGPDTYEDLLHRRPKISREQVARFFADKGRILIERFLHDDTQGPIPYDFKLYVAYDEVLYTRLIDRNLPDARHVALYDAELNRIPHDDFFYRESHPELVEHAAVELPLEGLRKGMDYAVQIGKRLVTPFISVDLYVVNDADVYLGELTWAPGPLVFEHMREPHVDFILSKIEEKQALLKDVEGSLA